MAHNKHITFGQFRLDEANECLWQGELSLTLRPKVFAVLKYLIDHQGQLVTKERLLEAIWHDTFVGDAVLKDAISQLREALKDNARSPRLIETVHRRGYRFIGQIEADSNVEPQPAVTSELIPTTLNAFPPASPPLSTSSALRVVGRKAALTRMHKWLEKSLQGERQIVFVTGEAGIGKTTLVETFLAEIPATHHTYVGRGQCLEQYGAGEAYLPVLDGLARLCREPGHKQIVEVIRRQAPTWLAQMPWLVTDNDREMLQQQMLGATRERMLREMAEALETLTATLPVILVLEDLHWSDYSTLDLISYLARRREAARLMVIATYRPVEVILNEHPLKGIKQELQLHRLCEELPLEYLTEEAIKEFLAVRFPEHQFPAKLVQLIHERTGGNPLFMINVVDYLLDEKIIVENQATWQLQMELAEVELGVPENIRHLIEKQIERLSPEEQRVLEGASVVGLECSAVAIAAALAEDVVQIEERCEDLARRQLFLSPPWIVELPDGMLTPRHKFKHILYLDVLYKRIPVTRRAQMHRRVSESGETVYGEQVTEIAAELAVHFEQGRDWQRAVKYLEMAAANASRRFAGYEALSLSRRGVELLRLIPESPERIPQELSLRLILGASLMSLKGFAATEVEEVYEPARLLCQQQGDSPQQFKVLWSLCLFYLFRAEVSTALEIAEQLLPLAGRLHDTSLAMEAHRALGVALVTRGKFSDALEHLNVAIALDEPAHHDSHFLLSGNDAKVMSLCFAAWSLWALGYAEQALERINQALSRAQKLAHTESLIAALSLAAALHQFRREATIVQKDAEAVIALAQKQGLQMWKAFGAIYRGWAQVEQGQTEKGIEQMQSGLAAYEATGAKLWRPHFLGLLAESLVKTGCVEAGLNLVNEALAAAQAVGEDYGAAELLRIKGELLICGSEDANDGMHGSDLNSINSQSPDLQAEAEACFTQAIAIANEQQARAWALKAAMSLSRLYKKQNKLNEARQSLTAIYNRFTEGFDTSDLCDARGLIENLSAEI
jgi:predicted ATPase/DNA-binding winged helix-turn-helix (wHTH) protein